MKTWIALLRGINVGGHHKLRMADLKRLLASIGFTEVHTYIQSGNVVFKGPDDGTPAQLGRRMAEEIERAHGFRPSVFVLSAEDFVRAMDANPFPEATSAPKSLHLFFLSGTPDAPDVDRIEAAASESERYHFGERAFYLHAPDGIGRSKLASNAERYIGVEATARNWRTVAKLRTMIDAQ